MSPQHRDGLAELGRWTKLEPARHRTKLREGSELRDRRHDGQIWCIARARPRAESRPQIRAGGEQCDDRRGGLFVEAIERTGSNEARRERAHVVEVVDDDDGLGAKVML